MAGVNIKDFYTRIQLKHDTETNWKKIESSFKPLAGEVIIYDADTTYNYPRVKIGDGNKFLSALNFLDDGAINEMAAAINNLSLEGTNNKIILKGTGTKGTTDDPHPTIEVKSGGATTATVNGNVLTITSTDSDENVKRTANAGSTALPLILAPSASDKTEGVVYNANITATPSTGTITATKFKGALEGKADTAGSADTAAKATYADTAGEAASAGQAGSVVGTLTLKSGDTTKTYNGSGNVEFSVTAADLGLSSAMHFKGTVTALPTISNGNYVNGDVILNTSNKKEYVCSNGSWVELGDEGSYALKTVKIVAGVGLDGGGALNGDVTISHEDTSNQASITADGRKYITGVTLDDFGHVTGLTTGTETVVHHDTKLVAGATGVTTNATTSVTNPYLATVDNSKQNSQVQIVGGGATTVTAAGGVITITSTDTNTVTTVVDNGTGNVVSDVTASNGVLTLSRIDAAPKVHNSDAAATYGGSTDSKFGHVKLTDVYTGGEDAADSVALSPKALADFAADAEKRPFHTVTENDKDNWVTFNCGTSLTVI